MPLRESGEKGKGKKKFILASTLHGKEKLPFEQCLKFPFHHPKPSSQRNQKRQQNERITQTFPFFISALYCLIFHDAILKSKLIKVFLRLRMLQRNRFSLEQLFPTQYFCDEKMLSFFTFLACFLLISFWSVELRFNYFFFSCSESSKILRANDAYTWTIRKDCFCIHLRLCFEVSIPRFSEKFQWWHIFFSAFAALHLQLNRKEFCCIHLTLMTSHSTQ